jgi:hypothetical protein
MKEARCIKCRCEFTYEPVLTQRGKPILRHICDECRSARVRFLKKKWKKKVRAPIRNRAKQEPRAAGKADGYAATFEAVAKRMGLHPSTVEMIQRAALDKIRSSPELREAFEHYAEAGMPRIKELLEGDRNARARGERLLEMQMQVADFWDVYERLQGEVRALDSDPPPVCDLPLWRQRERRALRLVQAEMAEIMAEIVRFQNVLQKEFQAEVEL